MKKVIYIFIALFLVSCGSNKTAGISTETTGEISSPVVTVQSILSNMENESYKEGELLVKFKSGVSASVSAMTHQAAGASVKKTFNIVPGLEHVKLPQGVSVSDAIVQYMSDPNVEYAEPNYIKQAFSVTPNDTYFSQQWALHNTGSFAGGSDDADIDAPEAWGITTGSSSVIIAVADTGIDYNHSELVGNIWTNTGESSCTDGVDNDVNGYTDDCIGWDFSTCAEFDAQPPFTCITIKSEDNDPIDDNGHGTHVAGTIGAVGNNGEGVSGVMWNAQLMPLKFLNSNGNGSTVDAILAIQYAVANGAQIINASYGSSSFSQSEYDAINSANTAEVLFIAAAGNAGNNNDLTPAYPASYNLPNIISVAATDQNDSRATFSNFGPVSVDVAAPGVYILNTVPPGLTSSQCTGSFLAGYDFCEGTSMSTPHVSGLAGLLYSYYTDFTYSQIQSTILRYVDVLPELTGWIQTGGRINADKALRSLYAPTNLTAAYSSSISLSWTDNATGEDGYKIERNVSGGGYVQIAVIGPDSAAYTDPGANSSTTAYSYRVRANNNIPADSSYSNEAVVQHQQCQKAR